MKKLILFLAYTLTSVLLFTGCQRFKKISFSTETLEEVYSFSGTATDVEGKTSSFTSVVIAFE